MADGDFLDELAYANRQRRYIAPPASTNALLTERENAYLTGIQNKQALESMVANLAYAPQDKPLYEELVNTTNSFLGSITPENMADSRLNTQQFASDFVNKKGGKQLVDNYTKYQAAIKAIDENKDIADPAMRDWYKKQINVTPVTKSTVTGMYQPGKVAEPNIAPFVDVGKELVDLFEGIKADGSVQENPDGTVTILKPVPGYLQYNVGEKVTRERLQEGLLGYIRSNPKITSYMEQRADYLASTQGSSTEAVFNRLTPEQKVALLGKEDATLQDYNKLIVQNSPDIETARQLNSKLLSQIIQSEETQNAMAPAISKYVYNNTKPTLIEDKMLMESLKYQADLNKAKVKESPDDLSSVSIQGWNTIQAMNPADIEVLDTRRTEIKNIIPTKQAELIQYQKAVNQGLPGYTSERLADLNMEIQSLDKEAEEIELQKRQIKEGVLDTAFKKGIDIEAEYKKSLPQLNKIYKAEVEAIKRRPNYKQGDELKLPQIPTLEQYTDLVINEYTTPASSIDGSKRHVPGDAARFDEHYIIDNLILPKQGQDLVDRINEVAGEFKDFKVTKDLSYISSVGATSKNSIKALNNYYANVQKNFSDNPETFYVGKVPLATWLNEELDIDNLRSLVDWKNTKITPLLQRDRNDGQLYGVNLKLTQKGEEELSDADKYKLSNAIKVPVTYKGINKDIQDAEVQSVLSTAFKDAMAANRTPHNINIMKAAGEMYANTTPLGKSIDAMNLYVVPPGESKTLNVNGEDIEIQSVARTARGTSINNTDFRLYRGSGNSKQVLVQNGNTSEWQNAKEAEKSGAIIDFNTPADIKQVLGAGQLYNQIKNSKPTQEAVNNPYEQYLQSGKVSYKESGYKLASDNDVQVANYGQYTRSMQSFFTGSGSTIPLVNNSGKTAYINSRVPLNSLTDLRSVIKSNVASNVQYPYVNSNIVNNVQNIVNTYGVLVSGGFRGEDTHNLKGSNKNSPHKYGFGLDFEDNDKGNELFNAVKNNPSLADQLGIARILKEDDHIHVEFKTNMI